MRTSDDVLRDMLKSMPYGIDKREGSVAYDAVAPCAVEFGKMYAELDSLEKELFADTASVRESLVRLAKERGVSAYPPTKAVYTGSANIDYIAAGKIFTAGKVKVKVAENYGGGCYLFEAADEGTAGNQAKLDTVMVPSEYINGLINAQLDALVIPGEDEEDISSLRKRFFDTVSSLAFGGNTADYRMRAYSLGGIGAVKVLPVWNGGGTVKLLILDTRCMPAAEALIGNVQAYFDANAPVGHVVTAAGAETETIDLDFEILLREGLEYDDIIPMIREAAEECFDELRRTWESAETLTVKKSRVESRILDVDGVEDIFNTTLNGVSANFTLPQNKVPVLGRLCGEYDVSDGDSAEVNQDDDL